MYFPHTITISAVIVHKATHQLLPVFVAKKRGDGDRTVGKTLVAAALGARCRAADGVMRYSVITIKVPQLLPA